MENKELQLQTPDSLIALAIQKDADIDKLEKLMNLKERWDATQSRKAFLTALSNFQSEVPEIYKANKVAFKEVRYQYASLGQIQKVIKDVLRKYGLSFRWEFQEKDDNISVTCIVSHLDGHSEKTTMSAKADASGSKNLIQQRGSSVTYLQRYSLIGALGLSTTDIDTDTNEIPKVTETKIKEVIKDIMSLELLGEFFNGLPDETKKLPKIKQLFTERKKQINEKV